jgi:type I restriction enzyme S subunit
MIDNTAYKNTSVGLIPSNWEVKKIKEIGDVSSGGTPDTTKLRYWNGDINWCTPTDITALKNKFLGDTKTKITEEGLKSSSAKILPPFSIIVCTRATIGKAAINTVPMSTNQGFKNIIPKNIDTDFLYYKILSEEKGLIKIANGSTFLEVSKTDFDNFHIAVPPLPEQQKIASILSTWDVAIDNCKAIIEELKVRNKGLEKLLLNNEKCIVKSEKWEKVIIGELGTSFNGLTGKTKVDFGKGKPYIPYLNIFNNGKLNNNYYDLVQINENDKQQKVQYGDILFTVSSETPNEVGMSSVVLFQPDELYLNSFCFGFRLFDFNTLLPKFACYYFRADVFRNKITALAQGATRFNLSKNQFKKLELDLPSLEYQEAIAKILDNATEELNQYQQKLQTLIVQKKGLMQQLLTGNTRVKI